MNEIPAKLPAQPADIDRHGIVVYKLTVLPPNRIQKLFLCENLSGIFHKIRQQQPFLFAQIHRDIPLPYLHFPVIQTDISRTKTAADRCFHTLHQGIYLGKKYDQAKRLGNIIIRTNIITAYNINFLIQRGEENQVYAAAFSYLTAKIQSAAVRKSDVTYDQ